MGGALWDCWVLRSGRRRSSQVHPVWIWPANPALLQVVEDIDVDIDNGDGDSCDPPSPPPHACVEKVFFILYCNIQDGGWWDQPPGEQMPGWYLPADCHRLQGADVFFLLQSRLFQCNANLTDLVFWIVLDWVEWVNNNTVVCWSYGRLKLNFLCKRFSPCIYSFCSIDLIYMKPNTSDSPYM